MYDKEYRSYFEYDRDYLREKEMEEYVEDTVERKVLSPAFRMLLRQMIEDEIASYTVSLELQNTIIEVVEKALYRAMHLKMKIVY